MWLMIGIGSLVAGLIMLALHWFPWQALLGKKLPRLAAYILGLLGIALPLTAMLCIWSDWQALLAMWIVAVAAGVATASGYAIDHWMDLRIRSSVAERETRALKEGLHVKDR